METKSAKKNFLVKATAAVFAFSLFSLLPLPAGASDDPSRVLVVYNANFPDENGDGVGDSRETAWYYARKRGVPAANILAVSCSQDFQYEYEAGWKAFFNEVVIPLRARLKTLGEEKIDYILTCYGMPVKFIKKKQFTDRAIDQILAFPFDIGTASSYKLPVRWWDNPYFEESPTVPPDHGHFDHTYKRNGYNMYLASRLSGPSVERALDLVDRALYGEKYLWPAQGFYRGTLYIDTQYKAYSDQELQGYPFGYLWYDAIDKNIAFSKFFAAASGYDWLWENTATELEIGDPGATFHDGTPAGAAPEALLYAGWYNLNKYNDVWEWIPGSAACDFNSLSILGIREENPPSFIANAFLHGLTCGTGVIFEPLTLGHQHPEVFFYAMLNGFNFAEACGLSTPGLCFSNMSVGDPIYNPHAAGKIPVPDTTPPPAPDLAVKAEPGIDTRRTIEVSIDTFGRDPDVVTAAVDYGPTSSYGDTVPYGTVFRISHDVVLDGLSPGAFYHFRVRVKDPAGLETATEDYIFYTAEPSPLIVDAFPDTQSVPANTPFTLNFHISSEGGLERVTAYGVFLTAKHLGIVDRNVVPALAARPYRLERDPGHDTYLYHFDLPGLPAPGSYVFRARAVHDGTTSAEDSCTVNVY